MKNEPALIKRFHVYRTRVNADAPCWSAIMYASCDGVENGYRFFAAAVLGENGITQEKQEGDGMTPIGTWGLREVLYRADRTTQPQTRLPCRPISPDDGWCDDPKSPDYNRPLHLPSAHGHEILWRADHLYDIMVVLGYNDAPPVSGRGSAIFMHLKQCNKDGIIMPTAGCIALDEGPLRVLLAAASADSTVCIHPS